MSAGSSTALVSAGSSTALVSARLVLDAVDHHAKVRAARIARERYELTTKWLADWEPPRCWWPLCQAAVKPTWGEAEAILSAPHPAGWDTSWNLIALAGSAYDRPRRALRLLALAALRNADEGQCPMICLSADDAELLSNYLENVGFP